MIGSFMIQVRKLYYIPIGLTVGLSSTRTLRHYPKGIVEGMSQYDLTVDSNDRKVVNARTINITIIHLCLQNLTML